MFHNTLLMFSNTFIVFYKVTLYVLSTVFLCSNWLQSSCGVSVFRCFSVAPSSHQTVSRLIWSLRNKAQILHRHCTALHTVHSTFHTTHCTLHISHGKLHSDDLNCTLYIPHCMRKTEKCTLHTKQTLHTDTVPTLLMYSAHFTVHTAYLIFHTTYCTHKIVN